jgi:hypothetical protein
MTADLIDRYDFFDYNNIFNYNKIHIKSTTTISHPPFVQSLVLTNG